MKKIVDAETNTVRHIATGREIITAFGVRYNSLYELFKDNLDENFDIENIDNEGFSLLDMKVFGDKLEFAIDAVEGDTILKVKDFMNTNSLSHIKNIREFTTSRKRRMAIVRVALIGKFVEICIAGAVIATVLFILNRIGII